MELRELKIGGVVMPTPKVDGFTISSNKIWSSNTGRTTDGRMVGTIVAIKAKISIKWPPLTEQQVAAIEAAVSNGATPFVPVEYTDMAGVTRKKTMYFSDISYTQSSWSTGLRYVNDVRVDAIEQ